MSARMIARRQPTSRILFRLSSISLVASILCASGFLCPAEANKQLVKSYAIENSVYQLLTESARLRSQGNNERARDLLAQAAQQDPTSYSADVHLQLAQCHKALRAFDAAILEAKLAMKYDPSRSAALYIIGQCYYETKRTDEALRTLKIGRASCRERV